MDLFAGADRTGQAAVIHTVGSVPQRLTEFDATTQHFNLLWAACGGIGWDEFVVLVGNKVFVVTITQDGFKNVFASAHVFSFNFSSRLSIGRMWRWLGVSVASNGSECRLVTPRIILEIRTGHDQLTNGFKRFAYD